MPGIVSKSQAKGVDFCGGYENYYIIHADLGCYMYSTNFHRGESLTVYSIHPSCQGGDHYFADTKYWYIIKGNTYRYLSDISKDIGTEVYDLHPNCRGGDHYLCSYGYFYIIFQRKGVFRQTTDLTTYSYGAEYKLHPNCRDGLYYWGTSKYFYLAKPKGEWGVQYHKTADLKEDTYANTYSFHPDVLNFLPGGLAETQGPAFGKWDLIKTITNDSKTPVTWEQRITRKVGYTKSKSSSIEHNWKVSMTTTYQAGVLTEGISKYQFSLTAEYGGAHVRTENENWEEATEMEEKVTLTMQPNEKVYFWQYKLGFGQKDVLFCRDLKFKDDPNPPTEVPLPPSKM
ncbi:uncharacterized protein LOC111193922 [Astyanax mexicanus]|uniref:uncharacterized protein LOC111193922 n=1 Tax=Astyanax mexicanus TaxID=7994 RepID=UPI0020CAE2C2|nr:uncharacterized protein LOC111193922 [Astyanax mexicanus]